MKDKVDAASEEVQKSKITCQRTGLDLLGGAPATVYALHIDNEGDLSDSKVWIGANHLVLKSELTTSGTQYTTLYDYSNIVPPANAKPIGGGR